MPAIFGYTLLNDVSARDMQFKDDQITLGKNFDGFAPLGPCIVTADALTAPGPRGAQTRLNGETHAGRQHRRLGLPAAASSSPSSRSVMHAGAGDIVSTGTPAGVGLFQQAAGLHEAGRRGGDRGRGHRRPAHADRRNDDWRPTRIARGGLPASSPTNHLNAWRDLAGEGACLVAVCDLDRAKAERAAQRSAAAPYTDVGSDARRRAARPRRHRHPDGRAPCAGGDRRGGGRRHDRAEAARADLAGLRRHRRDRRRRRASSSRCTRTSASRPRCGGCAS